MTYLYKRSPLEARLFGAILKNPEKGVLSGPETRNLYRVGGGGGEGRGGEGREGRGGEGRAT